MVTKFEKRTIALVLAVMMCLSIVLSGTMSVYAAEDVLDGNTELSSDGSGTQNSETGLTDSDDGEDGADKPSSDAMESRETTENPGSETETASQAEIGSIVTSGDYRYSVLEDGTVEITGYNGSEAEVTIPEQLDGKSVSIIGVFAFHGNQTITRVSIPKTVTGLQYWSFSSCGNLRTVILPDDSQLKTIGNKVFMFSGLTEFNCPSVQEVGEAAFYGCKNLSTVTFGDGLVSLGEGALAYSGIQNFTIPKGLTKLEDGLFDGCKDLTAITLPGNIKSIGNGTFYFSGLTKIKIPDSVTDIGEGAFAGCENLSEAEIGNSLAYIADSAFAGTGLENVIIGDNVKRIDDGAFSWNQKLKEIALPKNVTELGYAAFKNCQNLESISFPDSLKKIGGQALINTAWYEAQKDGVIYAGKVLYRFKGEMASDKVISVRDGTKGIAAYAFDGYENLKEVTIPNGVSNIGKFAFYGSKNMTSVTVPVSVTEIGEMALGYMKAGYAHVKIPEFTIYGVKGTDAETYARKNGFKFKEMAPPPLRIVTELTNTKYVTGSKTGAVIKCDGVLKYFIAAYMDGVKVDESNYTLEEGSTILTFKPEFLNTLPSGTHTVRMEYDVYGSIEVQLETVSLVIEPESKKTKYEIGSKTGAVIKCNGALEDFKDAYMDGVKVAKDRDYTLESGSTILTFKPEYLDTLSVGEHTVKMEYTYGTTVEVSLTVLAKQTGTGQPGTAGGGTVSSTSNNTASKNAISPKTGDQGVIMLWVLAAIFAAGVCAVSTKKRSEDLW